MVFKRLELLPDDIPIEVNKVNYEKIHKLLAEYDSKYEMLNQHWRDEWEKEQITNDILELSNQIFKLLFGIEKKIKKD